jgi:thermostable 8-oxoguanine DNA glycosylase
MKIENLNKYIELYGENYLFNVIGPKAREKGYLSFNDFYEICMWKSTRPKKKYLKNVKTIEDISRRAFAEKHDGRRMKILFDELEGVGIPTASALLTVVYPKKYAIIDIRCLEILRSEKLKSPESQKLGKTISMKTWLNYMKLMREWAKENRTTPRKLDMALFAMHKEWLKETGRNLYIK